MMTTAKVVAVKYNDDGTLRLLHGALNVST